MHMESQHPSELFVCSSQREELLISSFSISLPSVSIPSWPAILSGCLSDLLDQEKVFANKRFSR